MSSQEEQIQQRRANLAELVKLGVDPYPHAFARRHTVSELVESYGARDKDALEGERIDTVTSGRILAIRSFGKANFLVLSDGLAKIQIYVRQDALPPLDFQIFTAARFRGLGRRRRASVPHQDQRADHLGLAPALPRQVPAAAAREVARSDRRRDPLPPALPRSDRQPRLAPGVRNAEPDHRGDPRVHVRARLSRGRDADDAADRRRRARPAVHDASQHARHGSLSPHRAGAVPQAADRRRSGEGLRNQSELPERGDFDPAQPRIHDDGALRGVLGLPGADDPDRGAAGDGGDAGGRDRRGHLRRASDFAESAVRAAVPARRGARRPPRPGSAATSSEAELRDRDAAAVLARTAGPRRAGGTRRRKNRDRRSSRPCARIG